MGTTSLSTAMVRTIKRGSTIGYYRSVTNRISSFTIEKILFWVDTWYRTALCLRGCDQLCSGKLRWVRRKMYSTGCKRYSLSRIKPLSHRWFLIKDIKALVCPFAVLRSRFGFAILAFADGGSRNSSLHPPPEALGISTLAQLAFERRQWRIQRERQAAAVRKCESE